MRRSQPRSRRPTAITLAVASLAWLLAACGAGATPAPSDGPSATPSAPSPSAPPPTKVPGSDATTPTPAPGTIETPWGTAWDALPAGFPLPAGSRPADPVDPAADPVSASFVTELREGDVAKQVQGDLTGVGYSVEAIGGPAEDRRARSGVPGPRDGPTVRGLHADRDPLRSRVPVELTTGPMFEEGVSR
jgi:hypothetical protein